MSDFMVPDVDFQEVYEVETKHGTEVIPADLVGEKPTADDFKDYCEGEVYSEQDFTPKCQWTARLSAPGYLDCTDTASFDTEREAWKYLLEMYGDDDNPAEWEDDAIARIAELGGDVSRWESEEISQD